MKRFQILQINEENENAVKAMFMSFDRLEKYGITLTKDMYNVVYEGECEDSATVDDLFTMFNVNHPADFKGHSLSVSDIVFIDGKYYYCDSFGWEEVTFPTEEPQKEVITLTIPASKVNDLCKLLNKTKKNIADLEWNVGDTYKKVYSHYVCGKIEHWQHNVADATIEIPTVNDWLLIATVVKGALFVTNPKEKVEFTGNHGADYNRCDVCKHKATRKSFVVRNVKTGEELQVGSECAKKFNINLVNGIYRLTSELYEQFDLSIGDGEEDLFPRWRGNFSDPYAVRSVETSIVVQAAKKYYDDNNGVWKKGYYTDGGYGHYVPSESAQEIKGSLDSFVADEQNAYYVELKQFLNNDFTSDGSDFEENIKSVGTDFYLSAGNTAAAFFAIKKYEMWKRERANKEAGIYVPKCGDYVHIQGKVINKTTHCGYYGDYIEYEVLNMLDNLLYKRSGSVKADEEGNVDCYAFVDSTWNNTYKLGMVTKKAKKGLQIANVF